MESTYVLINRWMDKDHVIRTYTQWRISSHKEQNSIILKEVDELKVIVLSKKTVVHIFSHMWKEGDFGGLEH